MARWRCRRRPTPSPPDGRAVGTGGMISRPSPIRIAETASGRLRQETATPTASAQRRGWRGEGTAGTLQGRRCREDTPPRLPTSLCGAARVFPSSLPDFRSVPFPTARSPWTAFPSRGGCRRPAGLTDGRIPDRTEMILAVHLPIARIGEPLKSPAPMRAGSLARRMSVPPPHPIPSIETRRERHGARRRNDGVSGRGRPARFRRGPAVRRSPAGSRPARPAASAATCP